MPDLFQGFAFDSDGPTVDYIIYRQSGPFWYFHVCFQTEGEARQYLAQNSARGPLCVRQMTGQIIARSDREEKT